MSWEGWFVVGVIGVVFFGLIRNIAPDAVLIAALVAVGVAGLVTPHEMFAGFANTSLLTVAALFVVAAALRETGALDTLGGWVLGRATHERAAVRRLAVSVPGMSAFLNNTPIVAMFIPIIGDWCKRHRVNPSRLLLPLSYLSIFGGTCTLIGTSTNLVVNGLMVEAGRTDATLAVSLKGMTLFEMSRVGVPYAIVGTLYLYFVGSRLLPRRKGSFEQFRESVREYLVNMAIRPGCRLIDQNVETAGLRHLPGLFLVEIVREGQIITPVGPNEVLNESDVLTFTGAVDTIVELERIAGLVPVADPGYETKAVSRRGRQLCEAVVSNTCPLIGRSIRDSNFRAHYNAAVVAVHRGAERLKGRVGDVVLAPGDTLLLQTGPHFARAHRDNPDFFLVSGVEDSRPVRHDKAILAIVLLGLLIALMATGLLDVVVAAFLVAGLMVATRCISPSEARRSVDLQTLVTIGAAFGLGKALTASGCVSAVAHGVVRVAGGFGPYGVLAAVYAATALFTETVTNNAAAALMFPFGVAIAGRLGVDPRPFVMAIAFAASASFMTPLGYQTNLMVYGPGGYRFTDFVRVGFPLSLLLMMVAIILIPWAWPF